MVRGGVVRRLGSRVGLLLLLGFGSLMAFMAEVPFVEDPEIPKLTRRLCVDTLGVKLLGSPGAGACWCWRDQSDTVRSIHFFAVDRGWNRLIYWQLGDSHVNAYGQFGSGNGQFSSPGGMDLDQSGRLFVADRNNGRVVQLYYDFSDENLSFVRNIEVIGSERLAYPTDVRLDDNGTPSDPSDDCLWIVDPGKAAIFRMVLADRSLAGRYGELEEQPGAWFDYPVSIASGQFDGVNDHTVYVADQGHQRVIELEDSSGRIVWRRSRRLEGSRLVSVCTDYFGYVYVADEANSQVVRFDRNLENMQVYGSQGTGHGQLNHPRCFQVAPRSQQGFAIEKWADSSGIRMYNTGAGIASLQLPNQTFDATRDSMRIELNLESPARVSVRLQNGKTLLNHVPLDTGQHTFFWNGTDQSGAMKPPDQYWLIVEAWGTGTLTWYDIRRCSCRVKGTSVTGGISGTWTYGMEPVVPIGDVTVGPYSSLRIEPGVRVMPHGSRKLAVEGNLVAQGTAELPILFTPYRRLSPVIDTASPGRWQGIRIENHQEALCSLDHCILEYGGSPGSPGDSGFVVCNREAGLSLTNSVVRYSSTRGIWADPGNDRRMLIRGDTFEYIASYPAAVLVESVASVANSCGFRENGISGLDVHAEITSHEVQKSAVWPCKDSGWHYDVDGYLYVRPESSGRYTLTVAPGVTMRFGHPSGLRIGSDNSSRTAFLRADGSAGPITFTSLSTSDRGDGIHGGALSPDARKCLTRALPATKLEAGSGLAAGNDERRKWRIVNREV